MLPDSARELKARLSQRLSGAAPGAVVASPAGGATRWSGVSLGLRPVGLGQVHLAVRLISQEDADVVLAGLDGAARAEVDVRVIGRVRLLTAPPASAPEDLQQRVRPLRPGLSVGHVDVTAGTLGGFVRRPGGSGLLVLSNSHVLADSGAAAPGDPVLQPGVADGGTLADRVAQLAASVPFSDEPGDLVDAAVAALDAGVPVDPAGYPGGALLGQVATADEVDPDELVEKVGRTTGHTRGRITAVEVDGGGRAVRRRGAHLRRPGGGRGAHRGLQRRRGQRLGHLAQSRPGAPRAPLRRLHRGRQCRWRCHLRQPAGHGPGPAGCPVVGRPQHAVTTGR